MKKTEEQRNKVRRTPLENKECPKWRMFLGLRKKALRNSWNEALSNG